MNTASVALDSPNKTVSPSFPLTGEDYARSLVTNANTGFLKYALDKEIGILYRLDIYMTVVRTVDAFQKTSEDMTIEQLKHFCDNLVFHIDRAADVGSISSRYLSFLAHEQRRRDLAKSDVPEEIHEIDNDYRNITLLNRGGEPPHPWLARIVIVPRVRLRARLRHFWNALKRSH